MNTFLLISQIRSWFLNFQCWESYDWAAENRLANMFHLERWLYESKGHHMNATQTIMNLLCNAAEQITGTMAWAKPSRGANQTIQLIQGLGTIMQTNCDNERISLRP
jgi:hypothetical protein